ncbi:MAG: FAD-dependent thymidylate synthase [Oscillospiraceae bacterium]|jgi:thymidylate synthase (FAD)|nr:FAD-dependent thymidylate synthase [Oscillospiraceae bacterium]
MAINVTLLSHTPNPEQTVAMAAKLCYSPATINTIKDGLTPEKTADFIKMLADMGHESPMEHASFTFGIEGVSRACSHQFVRHRIASYSQQSQRYVDGCSFDFVIPPAIEANPAALLAYEAAAEATRNAYAKIRFELIKSQVKEQLGEDITEEDLQNGTGVAAKFKKEIGAIAKTANEDARFVLPNACTTAFVVTMNTRSLMNFFAHRCCNRAQWEIQIVADKMLALCKATAPGLFKRSGPNCLYEKCPEGRMTCGKQIQVKEKYAQL